MSKEEQAQQMYKKAQSALDKVGKPLRGKIVSVAATTPEASAVMQAAAMEGIELTAQEAASLIVFAQEKAQLSDEELDSIVAAGGDYSS